MKKLIIILMTTLTLLACTSDKTTTISRVIDGDTFDVQYGSGDIDRIRLLGVDTPETYSKNKPDEYEGITNIECLDEWGDKATTYAIDILSNNAVILASDPLTEERDYYDRLLSYIEIEGKDFSAMLLENGYARVYTESKTSRTDSYLILEENAKKNKLGLWGCPTLPTNIE